MVLSPITVVLLAGVFGMAVAFLVWLHRDRPGAGPLAVFVVGASLWTVAYGVEFAVPGIRVMERLLQVQLTLSVIVPVAWLVTVIEYSGHPHWLTRRRIVLLLLEPALFVTLVWSNSDHQLVWTDGGTSYLNGSTVLAPAFGVAYWGHLAYMLVLVLAGGVLLLRMMVQSNQLFRGQGLALLTAIAIPTLGHALFLFNALPVSFDPTSLGYLGSGIVLSVAILRTKLLDVAPVTRELGREAIFTEMDDQVVIVDEELRIVDVNASAATLFDRDPASLVGHSLATELPKLAQSVPDPGERAQTEMTLQQNGAVRFYDVRVTPLFRAYGVVSGHLVSLRDITDRRQREQRLDVLNRLLRHDIRNEMNVVQGNADLLHDSVDADDHDRISRIIRTVDNIVDRSNKIGRVTEALESEEHHPIQLRSVIEPAIREVRSQHPEAAISLDCPADSWIEGGPSVSIAFEELMMNAVEHGTGTATADAADEEPSVTVDIAVERREQSPGVVVRVRDDGPGIDEHEQAVIQSGTETPLKHGSGVGLWLVNWIVRNLGGRMSFVEPDRAGTTVELQLPGAAPTADAGEATEADEPTAADLATGFDDATDTAGR